MIRDSSNTPMSRYTGELAASQVVVCTVNIDCVAGTRLYSSTTSSFVVEGRAVGDTDWVDLESDSIDLEPYAPSIQAFEIRITGSGGLVGRNRFKMTVGA